MKFGVIGEPCIDFIHRGGKESKSLGGILYSAVSLAVIAPGDEVYPIMNLGNDEYDNIVSFLGKFPNIKTDFINRVQRKTRVVNLYYKGLDVEFECPKTGKRKTYDREESSTDPAMPVDYDWIKPALSQLEGILVNMVSGIDITIETLQQIRKNYKGYIHLDIHNVVMQTNDKGERTQSSINNWEAWCCSSDTLQMNESELHIITPEKLSEYEFAERVLTTGAESYGKALVVTRGKAGVSLFRKVKKKVMGEEYFEIDKSDLATIESNHFADSTGCGDVFASGFFYKSIKNNRHDYKASMNFANRTAGEKTKIMGVEELHKLKVL
jgi:hypothetical protein